ncbi:MAG: NADH-quinone oxidoreductase subunit F [Nocardia sp.]|nr:NADH-quinone oxidoreductase subunit F [Nocardia sp.]
MTTTHFATAPTGPNRLLAAATPDLDAHQRSYGPRPPVTEPSAFIAAVAAAGLRDANGFPVHRTISPVAGGRRAVVVADGGESEPYSRNSSVLLGRSPHLVLDGLSAATAAVKARECHLYAPPPLVELLREAVLERRASGYDCRPIAVSTAGQTASTDAPAAAPRARDRVVGSSSVGLRKRPTLIQSPETFAQLALIERFGAEWFRAVGTADEPGTTLLTLSGEHEPTVAEVEFGTRLADLIDAGYHTDPARIRAVLLGGCHGTWIPGSMLTSATLSSAALRPLNADIGPGVLKVLGRGECGLRATADITALATRTPGRCCRRLEAADPRQTSSLPGDLAPATACDCGRITRLLRSALDTFGEDLLLHRRGTCEARGNLPDSRA